MQKVLIIEDEKEIARIQKDYLEKSGYIVVIAEDGESGLNTFYAENPDIIILDLNLPKLDGYKVCRKIREVSGLPIIMVTAKTKEIDELLGLELGADDYVKKPFSPKVLVSRVKSLLKRVDLNNYDSNIIIRDNFEVNIEKRTIKKNDKHIDLTTIQFDLFIQLFLNPGKVFTRDNLMDKAYDQGDMVDIFDRTIDSHIKNIRKQIEEDPRHPKYILTVRGVGYKYYENN